MGVYTAGPMTGRPNLNRGALGEAADRPRRNGRDPVDPARRTTLGEIFGEVRP